MLLQVILEGLGLGALLVLVCAIGIRKGLSEWCIFIVTRCSSDALNWDRLQKKESGEKPSC